MAGFYHFFPKVVQAEVVERHTMELTKSFLHEWKIADLFEGCSNVKSDMLVLGDKGPKGSPGLFVYPQTLSREHPPQFGADKLKWISANDGSRRMIGWDEKNPPRPEDLQRDDLLGIRYSIEDKMGQKWMLTTARERDTGKPFLPTLFEFKAGKLGSRVDPAYNDLWEFSGVVWDKIGDLYQNDKLSPEDEVWVALTAVRLLGINYRIGPGEINALIESGSSLLTSSNAMKIVLAFADFPLLEEYIEHTSDDNGAEKKSEESAPA